MAGHEQDARDNGFSRVLRDYDRGVTRWKPSRPVLIALLILHVIVTAMTLRDLSRRSDAEIRGPRWFWRVVAPLQMENWPSIGLWVERGSPESSRREISNYFVTSKVARAVSEFPCWRGWETTPAMCSFPIVPLNPNELELLLAVSVALTA